MTQKDLDALHEGILTLISHYLSGILTAVEFKNAMSSIKPINDWSDLTDLIDPATGLRYQPFMFK
jgi:hypothetical protein